MPFGAVVSHGFHAPFQLVGKVVDFYFQHTGWKSICQAGMAFFLQFNCIFIVYRALF